MILLLPILTSKITMTAQLSIAFVPWHISPALSDILRNQIICCRFSRSLLNYRWFWIASAGQMSNLGIRYLIMEFNLHTKPLS